jgi:hypothetical protein
MSRARRWLAGAGLTAVGTLALGWLSQVPYDAAGDVESLIRLAWRTRGTRVEECRRLTSEELERLPVHMRQEEVCQGRTLPYRLVVALDGRTVADEEVHPAGARADRPLYVYREFPLRPGWHDLEVQFTRAAIPQDTARVGDGGGSADQEGVAPQRMALRERVMLGADQIVLVTYDAGERRLVLKGAGVP